MKGGGWRLICLIALSLSVVLAEKVVSNDLKSGNHSVEIKENEGSRSGAISESRESVETAANTENKELQKTSDDAEVASASETPALDTKRSWTDNFKQSDIVQNNLRPGYLASQGHIANQPSQVHLSSTPSEYGQQAYTKELYKSLLSQEKNHQPGYHVKEGIHDQNEYEYSPNNMNVQNANQILTYGGGGVPSSDMSANQVLITGSKNQGMLPNPRSGTEDMEDANESKSYSRLIPHSERILLHKIPGAINLLSCSREGELHNFWSSSYQCLVCACIRDDGVLRPVCASCAGCMNPNPGFVDIPEIEEGPEIDIIEMPTPGRPSIPGIDVTTSLPPIEEEVTCSPLPSGQPFDNPLHPCQVCICIESINMYGKPDVNIKCQENPQCVLPTDSTVITPIPDVPVPSPHCDKFPLNVLFPHPSDACKTCQCSVQVSQLGVSEKLITCLPNPNCTPNNLEPEIITETPEIYPVTPYYPIPVEPQIVPTPVSPEPVPFFEIDTPETSPAPWTPATVAPPSPHGPLPGPSPHDSCRPYVPNRPFQHPWDECQMCVCTEAFSKKHITIEINCFTKKSCCIEPPFEMITATLPPISQKQTGKLKIQDAICEYKTFGVEFIHPREPCKICTCELQGHLITPLCKRSSKPECQLVSTYPTATATFEEVAQGHSQHALGSQLPPGFQLPPSSQYPPNSISSYNSASSSQNKAIKNAYVTYQNPYGSSGLQTMGSSQASADQQASSYKQWDLQNLQRPADLSYRPQNLQGTGGLQLGSQNPDSIYGSQNLDRPGNQYGYGTGYQGRPGYQQTGANLQNYPGYINYGQSYPGYQPALRPSEVISQAQTKATASASAAASSGLQSSYAFVPGYQYPGGPGSGYPGYNKAKIQQFAQSSASANAQASSISATKYRGRSGNPEDKESSEKEN